MKRIKALNGYTIYQAATQRDADYYNCQVGDYSIYLSSDIRDFGLSCSYPEWDGVDSLAVAVAMCKGSSYAVAVELAEELSNSTIQDMDLVLEIERRLDAGEALETIRDSYNTEEQCFTRDCLGDTFDPYKDHPSIGQYGIVIPDDCPIDEDLLDGDLEDIFDAAMEEAALRDWELSTVDVGDYMIDGDRAWKVTGKDHSTGEWHFTVESPCGESYCVDAEAAGRCTFIGAGADWSAKRRVAELWTGHAIASRATYYVVEIDGDYITATVNGDRAWYETDESWINRRRYIFLRTVAERLAFNDCSDDRVLEIVFDGCRIEYAGWQPGMLIEFREATTGLVVFSESFPEWDH